MKWNGPRRRWKWHQLQSIAKKKTRIYMDRTIRDNGSCAHAHVTDCRLQPASRSTGTGDLGQRLRFHFRHCALQIVVFRCVNHRAFWHLRGMLVVLMHLPLQVTCCVVPIRLIMQKLWLFLEGSVLFWGQFATFLDLFWMMDKSFLSSSRKNQMLVR